MSFVFAKKSMAVAVLMANVLAVPLSILSPATVFASEEVTLPSAAEIASCRADELAAYRETLVQAFTDFSATVRAQWDRQVGFRTGAATVARRASVTRTLETAGRRHSADLTRQADAYRLRVLNEGRLAELVRTNSGDALDEALTQWAETRLPSDATLRAPVASMERTLRLYANTRDRGIIRTVWADMTKGAFAQLEDDITTARGAVALGYASCAYQLSDETTIDPTMSSDSASSSGSVPVDPTMPVAGTTAATDGTSSSAPAANTRPSVSRDDASSSGAATSPSAVAGTPIGTPASVEPISSVELTTATELALAEPCTANVVLRAVIRGRRESTISGYFMFADGTVSQIYSVRMGADGVGQVTHSQRQGMSGYGSSREISGLAKFVAFTGETRVESNRATYAFDCRTGVTAATSGAPNAPSTPGTTDVAGVVAPKPTPAPTPVDGTYNPTKPANDGSAAASPNASSQPAFNPLLSATVVATAATVPGDVCRADLALRASVSTSLAYTKLEGRFKYEDGTFSNVLLAQTDITGVAQFSATARRNATSGMEVSGSAIFIASMSGYDIQSKPAYYRVTCASPSPSVPDGTIDSTRDTPPASTPPASTPPEVVPFIVVQSPITEVTLTTSATAVPGDVCRADVGLVAVVMTTKPYTEVVGQFKYENGSTSERMVVRTDFMGKAQFFLTARRAAASGSTVSGSVMFTASLPGAESESKWESYRATCVSAPAPSTPDPKPSVAVPVVPEPAQPAVATIPPGETGVTVTAKLANGDSTIYTCGPAPLLFTGKIAPQNAGKVFPVTYTWQRSDYSEGAFESATVGPNGFVSVTPFAWSLGGDRTSWARLHVISNGQSYYSEQVPVQIVQSCKQ